MRRGKKLFLFLGLGLVIHISSLSLYELQVKIRTYPASLLTCEKLNVKPLKHLKVAFSANNSMLQKVLVLSLIHI